MAAHVACRPDLFDGHPDTGCFVVCDRHDVRVPFGWASAAALAACREHNALHHAGERRIRETDPRHRRDRVERRVQRSALRLLHHPARLLQNQRRADIVRVTHQRRRHSQFCKHLRPDVAEHPIVPHEQLVNLPARRDVLIVEHQR